MRKLEFTDEFKKAVERFSVINGTVASFSQEKGKITAKITFKDFTAEIAYSLGDTQGYTFLESSSVAGCLLTKFKFPFSPIAYSIYDIHNAVDDKIFITYDFHNIHNSKELSNALETVFAFMVRNYDRISSISTDVQMQKRLNDYFKKSLDTVMKKVSLDEYCSNTEKYEKKYYNGLYVLRCQATEFTDFILHGKVKKLQRFYAKTKKLLPFEERYLEYLYQTDFAVDENIKIVVENNTKYSNVMNCAARISLVIGVALMLITHFIVKYITEKVLFDGFTLFCENAFAEDLLFLLLGFGYTILLLFPVFNILEKKKDIEINVTKTPVTFAVTAFTLICAIVFLSGGIALDVYKTENIVALSDESVYVFRDGKKNYYSYDDVDFYLIEGEYYDDVEYIDDEDYKQYILVVDGDFENYYASNYDYENLKDKIENKTQIKQSFKSYNEFEDAISNKNGIHNA